MKQGRPDSLQIIEDARRAGRTHEWWAEVVAVGNGRASARSATGSYQNKRLVGTAKVGDVIKAKYEDGNVVLYGNDTVAGNGAGLVVFSPNSGGEGGGGGARFPLAHASTHFSGGSDAIAPANIGAATPAQITSAIASHLGTADPHTQYLLSAGDAMTGTLASSPFASGSQGWQVNLQGDAEIRNLSIRQSLHAQSYFVDLVGAHRGTDIVAKSAATLTADMICVAGTTTFDWPGSVVIEWPGGDDILVAGNNWEMDVTDAPGSAGRVFDDGDILNVKSADLTAIYETWFRVSSFTTNGDGTQHYVCTFASGTLPALYRKGTAVVDYGQDGQGILKATVTGANGPYYDVITHNGAPWLTQDVQVRIGNLTGIVDTDYGILSGYGLYATNVWLKGAIHATWGTIGGLTILTNKLTMGSGEFNDSNTPFYVDHNGGFSLGAKFHWNPLWQGGTLVAGGWSVDTDSIDSTGVSLVSATGDVTEAYLTFSSGATEINRISASGMKWLEDSTATPPHMQWRASLPSGALLGQFGMTTGYLGITGDTMMAEVFTRASQVGSLIQSVYDSTGGFNIRNWGWHDATNYADDVFWQIYGMEDGAPPVGYQFMSLRYTHSTNTRAIAINAGGSTPKSTIVYGNFGVSGLSVYANNAAAVAGGLTAGQFYRNNADPDHVCVVH